MAEPRLNHDQISDITVSGGLVKTTPSKDSVNLDGAALAGLGVDGIEFSVAKYFFAAENTDYLLDSTQDWRDRYLTFFAMCLNDTFDAGGSGAPGAANDGSMRHGIVSTYSDGYLDRNGPVAQTYELLYSNSGGDGKSGHGGFYSGPGVSIGTPGTYYGRLFAEQVPSLWQYSRLYVSTGGDLYVRIGNQTGVQSEHAYVTVFASKDLGGYA